MDGSVRRRVNCVWRAVPAGAAGTHGGGALTLYAAMMICDSVTNCLPLLCVIWCCTCSSSGPSSAAELLGRRREGGVYEPLGKWLRILSAGT